MSQLKPRQIRVYLNAEELEILNELVLTTGLRETYILSFLSTSALRAVKAVDYRVPLALKFKIVTEEDPRYRLNDPAPATRKTRG